jgi:hypothetical protein
MDFYDAVQAVYFKFGHRKTKKHDPTYWESIRRKVFPCVEAMNADPVGRVIQDSVDSKAFYCLFMKYSEVPIAKFEPSVTKTEHKTALHHCLLASPVLEP